MNKKNIIIMIISFMILAGMLLYSMINTVELVKKAYLKDCELIGEMKQAPWQVIGVFNNRCFIKDNGEWMEI